MRQTNEEKIYGYDGQLPLTQKNWKCASCSKYNSIDKPCYVGYTKNNPKLKTVFPNIHLEPTDECEYHQQFKNINTNTEESNVIKVTREANGKKYTATVDINPEWNDAMKQLAVEKANSTLDKQIMLDKQLDSQSTLNNDDEPISELPDDVYNSDPVEDTLKGDISISWFNKVTSWKRVLNAARRTIGKTPSENEPSDSWKAKILLAEHSPIRLLEYDWGWSKIRQWVSVHLVRHHEGVEKFVHSQRSDRRELPCDRDKLYQGARNDMDMSANAQAIINISRKRCCNCASKETREAWSIVLDELKKVDPVFRSKCVPECVYRGFCPEWMSKCNYSKTDNYKKQRAEYVNTKYGKDVIYWNYSSKGILVSNTGHVYITPKELSSSLGIIDNGQININELVELEYKKEFIYGQYHIYVEIDGNKYYVAYLVNNSFSEDLVANPFDIMHIDGNEWNNNIDNLKYIGNDK